MLFLFALSFYLHPFSFVEIFFPISLCVVCYPDALRYMFQDILSSLPSLFLCKLKHLMLWNFSGVFAKLPILFLISSSSFYTINPAARMISSFGTFMNLSIFCDPFPLKSSAKFLFKSIYKLLLLCFVVKGHAF